MYVALHYVRVNGKMYTRGEILPEGLPAEKIAWYQKAGAIEEIAPVSNAKEMQEEYAPEQDPEDQDAEAIEIPEDTEPSEGTEEEPEDEFEEAPEIDVMAGIVPEGQEDASEEEEQKPSAKKTGGRRKNK